MGLKNMTRKIPNPPPGFDELTVEEKLDYVQSLWDRIAADPEKIPLPLSDGSFKSGAENVRARSVRSCEKIGASAGLVPAEREIFTRE